MAVTTIARAWRGAPWRIRAARVVRGALGLNEGMPDGTAARGECCKEDGSEETGVHGGSFL
jgi:hypothetical protein